MTVIYKIKTKLCAPLLLLFTRFLQRCYLIHKCILILHLFSLQHQSSFCVLGCSSLQSLYVRVCVYFGCHPAHLFSASSGLLLRPLCATLPLNQNKEQLHLSPMAPKRDANYVQVSKVSSMKKITVQEPKVSHFWQDFQVKIKGFSL